MKNKVRVKKRYKRQKKQSNRFVLYFCLIVFVLVILWVLFEVTKPKVAKEWEDSKESYLQNIILPKDDGYHSDRMEWWYYNGSLVTKNGREFSFHFVTFLLNGLTTHTVMHSSLGDHLRNQYYSDQSRTAGNTSVGVENGFIFKYRNWLMQGDGGHDRLKVENEQFAFDLQLESTQSVVNHGNEGILSLGFAGSSYYYSRTRMKITGTLKVGRTTEQVRGVSWFDHQWGNFTTVELTWDWFSLQLDNGVDLMIYQLRDKQGSPVNYAASISEKGETEILENAEFILTPGRTWISKNTGKSYPVTWNLKIPKRKIDLKIQSIIENSEFDAKLTTFIIYWEGAVKVEGSHTGQGFMELNRSSTESK